MKVYLRIAIIALISLFPLACADLPLNATPEIHGIVTSTSVEALGSYSESDAIAWTGSNLAIDAPPLKSAGDVLVSTGGGAMIVPHLPVFGDILSDSPGEIQYTMAYSEETLANQGQVTYLKSTSLNTANKVVGQQNLEASKTVVFDAMDGGGIISSEDLLVDGAASVGKAGGRYLCPFATQTGNYTPIFCNIAETGSRIDMTTVSLSTTASERHVAATADVPVTVGYSIDVTGIGNRPAAGSVSADMKAHLQKGGIRYLGTLTFFEFGTADVYLTGKKEDIQYSESTSASGSILKFTKQYSYDSGRGLL